jgi:hypothetical protein
VKTTESSPTGIFDVKQRRLSQEYKMHVTAPHPTHTEGSVARAIEQQTAKVPSDWFLWAAGGSIATSVALQISGKRHASTFVGQWAPTFLILGLYNKLVKQLGSDRTGRADV